MPACLLKKGLEREIVWLSCFLIVPNIQLVFFGTLLNGAIVVQINPMYKANELMHVLKDSGARHIIVLDDLLPIVEAVIAETDVEKVLSVSLEKGQM
ncbi:AMP-binding protein [Peribacillus frigoritolerans]|nr:AMP-binding protein [Peribacillus frigoritolerans]